MLYIISAGHVTFVPSLYTGCISDTKVFERSGFLSLQKGDEIMANCGFTIEDILLLLGVQLNFAPFLVNKAKWKEVKLLKLSRSLHFASVLNDQFAIKEFDMLSGVIPASVAASANQILKVCCLLTNFQNLLISC